MFTRKSSRIKEKDSSPLIENSSIKTLNRSQTIRKDKNNTKNNTNYIKFESVNSPDTPTKEDKDFIFIQHFLFLLHDRYRLNERICSPEILYELLTTLNSVEVPELTLEEVFKSLLKPLNGHRNPSPLDSILGIVCKLYNRYSIKPPVFIEPIRQANEEEEEEKDDEKNRGEEGGGGGESRKKQYTNISSLSSNQRLLILNQICEFQILDIDNFWKMNSSTSDESFWRLDEVGQDTKGNPLFIIGNYQLFHLSLSSQKWTLICSSRNDWNHFFEANTLPPLSDREEKKLFSNLRVRFEDDVVESLRKEEKCISSLNKRFNLKIPNSFSDFGIKRSSRIQALENIRQQQFNDEIERIKTERHLNINNKRNASSSFSFSDASEAKKQPTREERMRARDEKMMFNYLETEDGPNDDDDVNVDVSDASTSDTSDGISNIDEYFDSYGNNSSIREKIFIRLPNPIYNINSNSQDVKDNCNIENIETVSLQPPTQEKENPY